MKTQKEVEKEIERLQLIRFNLCMTPTEVAKVDEAISILEWVLQ